MNIIENIRNRMPSSKEALSAPETARLESMLQGTLVAVAPRKDFVDRLNRQLITTAPLTRDRAAPLSIQNPKTRENLLIGAATVLGAVAIFATGFRVAITLVGALGLLAQWLSRRSAEKHSPIQPAV